MTKLEYLTTEVLRWGSTNPDCMIWPFGKEAKGYGRVGVPGKKTKRVHQIAYELVKGEVPSGKEINHACLNKLCFNPAHLEALTKAQHDRFSIEHGQRPGRCKWEECPKGHTFNEENTYIGKNGRRQCRICRKNRMAESYQKKKAKQASCLPSIVRAHERALARKRAAL